MSSLKSRMASSQAGIRSAWSAQKTGLQRAFSSSTVRPCCSTQVKYLRLWMAFRSGKRSSLRWSVVAPMRNRSKSPWASSSAELDEIWRKRVVNDALNLALEDEPWEKIQEVLTKRYKGFIRRLDQVNNDDVFERFMNAFAHALDPHSSYLSPRNSEEYRIQMSLSYFGIGASLQTEDDLVKIVGIIPGGPAAIDGKTRVTTRARKAARFMTRSFRENRQQS